MKKFLMLVLCFALVLPAMPVYAASGTRYFYDGKWHDYKVPPITLRVNGENIQSDMPPIIFNNSSVVPARAVFEKLGAKVEWDAKKAQVKVAREETTVLIKINSVNAVVNGAARQMPVAPKIVNNRTMIPVRFVAETLGMKVDWNAAQRLIKINLPDFNINNIKSSMNGSTLRITVSSDSKIGDYSTLEVNDYPRLAVDIKNAVLKTDTGSIDVNSNYVYRVRASSSGDDPGVTRVVADMRQWTKYSVTLSQDKKQLFIDIDDRPVDIKNLTFSKTDGTDNIDIDTGYLRKPTVAAPSENGKVVVDIPMASAAALQKAIPAAGNFVKSIECSQYDTTTARFVISTQGTNLFETVKRYGGIRLKFSPPSAENISYGVGSHPKFTLRSRAVGANYFNYRYRSEDGKFILSFPSSAIDMDFGRILVNDENVNYIDIAKNYSTSLTDVTISGKKQFQYRVDSISESNALTVNMLTDVPDSAVNGSTDIDQKIKTKTVVIDPGHGGSEYGATFPFNPASENEIQVKEKDLNLDISMKLYEMLKNAGFSVQITRQDDSNVGLYERGDFANNQDAALLVSVHNNSGDTGENGTMTLFNPMVYDEKYDISGERLAQITQEEMLKSLGTNDRGLWKRPMLIVLNNSKMPSIIAEVAYISDESDRQKLQTDSFRSKAAEALYNSTVRALREIVVSEDAKAREIGGMK